MRNFRKNPEAVWARPPEPFCLRFWGFCFGTAHVWRRLRHTDARLYAGFIIVRSHLGRADGWDRLSAALIRVWPRLTGSRFWIGFAGLLVSFSPIYRGFFLNLAALRPSRRLSVIRPNLRRTGSGGDLGPMGSRFPCFNSRRLCYGRADLRVSPGIAGSRAFLDLDGIRFLLRLLRTT